MTYIYVKLIFGCRHEPKGMRRKNLSSLFRYSLLHKFPPFFPNKYIFYFFFFFNEDKFVRGDPILTPSILFNNYHHKKYWNKIFSRRGGGGELLKGVRQYFFYIFPNQRDRQTDRKTDGSK